MCGGGEEVISIILGVQVLHDTNGQKKNWGGGGTTHFCECALEEVMLESDRKG